MHSITMTHVECIAYGALWTIGLSAIAFVGGSVVGFLPALARIAPLSWLGRLAAG